MSESLRAIITSNLKGKTIIQMAKILVEIIKDDSQSQVKDLCVEILLILKTILSSDNEAINLDKYEKLIASLSNFRVNMINSGITKSFKDNLHSEKQYKANLNKIKSNLRITSSRNRSIQRTTESSQTLNSASKDKESSQFKNKFLSNKYRNTEASLDFNKLNSMHNDNLSNCSSKEVDRKKNLSKLKSQQKFNAKNLLMKNKDKQHSKEQDSNCLGDDDNINFDSNKNFTSKSKSIKNKKDKSPNIMVIKKKAMELNENTDEANFNLQKPLRKRLSYQDDSNSIEKYDRIEDKNKDKDYNFNSEIIGKLFL